jgi:VIT1/CCC1 family predicted Fe2+/Mn2+ transporter
VSGSPNNVGISIILYIIGVMLVLTAVLIVLKGLGVLTTLPNYAIWAMLLLAAGIGILGGLRNSQRR